jgi:hypothetical protein
MAVLTARTLKTMTVATLAIGTAVVAAVTTAGLTWPTPFAVGLAPAHETLADQALLAQYPEPIKADRESEAALLQAPMSSAAWMRRAYIRQINSGVMDATGLNYVEESYKVAPLGPDISRWRLRFVFEHWPDMTPSLRTEAVRELRNFAHYHRGGPDLVRSIHNPSGRWAAALTERLGHNDALQELNMPAKAAE